MSKKKVVSTGSTSKVEKPLAATTSRSRGSTRSLKTADFTFRKDNYIWMLIGFGVIVLGLLLMSGGAMPSPDVWDESIIYSFRRITLAPFIIITGLVLEVYAIFK